MIVDDNKYTDEQKQGLLKFAKAHLEANRKIKQIYKEQEETKGLSQFDKDKLLRFEGSQRLCQMIIVFYSR